MKSDIEKRLVKCIVIFQYWFERKIATIRCPSLIVLEFGFLISKNLLKRSIKLKTAIFSIQTKAYTLYMYDDAAWYLAQLNNFIKS
jgi:hypothetical protein